MLNALPRTLIDNLSRASAAGGTNWGRVLSWDFYVRG